MKGIELTPEQSLIGAVIKQAVEEVTDKTDWVMELKKAKREDRKKKVREIIRSQKDAKKFIFTGTRLYDFLNTWHLPLDWVSGIRRQVKKTGGLRG